MSITRAIERAYNTAIERSWENIFWCVDLHGTVLKANYKNDSFEFYDDAVAKYLKEISDYPETKIILWSSIYDADLKLVLELFNQHSIAVEFVNENPVVPNSQTGNFTEKFYFSILVDDKAGFHPDEWEECARVTKENHQRLLDAQK
jgi:hypothetical protein